MSIELLNIERREDEFGFTGLVAKLGVALELVPAVVDVMSNRIDEIFFPGPWCGGDVDLPAGFAWAEFEGFSASINSEHELELFVSDPFDAEMRELTPETDWVVFAPFIKQFVEAVTA